MRRSAVVLILSAAIVLVGCSKDDGPPTAPAPPGPPAGSTPETEPNDAAPQALGVLSAKDLLVAGTSSTRSDVDYFSVTLDSIRSLHTSLTWTGSQDLEVGVTDVNGIMVRNTDTPTGNPEACTVGELPPGTYRVRVGSRSTSAVSYLLTIGRR
jgi:hypothetical protein